MVSFVNSGVSIGIGRIPSPHDKGPRCQMVLHLLRILLPQFHHSNLNDKPRDSLKFLQLARLVIAVTC